MAELVGGHFSEPSQDLVVQINGSNLMNQADKPRYWHNDFCGCCNNMAGCLLIFCFGYLGLACVHCSIASQANYSPVIAFLCDFCCCNFGAAYNRMKIREAVGIPGDYCYDCVVYQQGCLCCYGVQECVQLKNMQGRMPTKQ